MNEEYQDMLNKGLISSQSHKINSWLKMMAHTKPFPKVSEDYWLCWIELNNARN